MRIGIDARPLSYEMAGTAIYLKNLLDELQKYDKKNYYFLISNCDIKYDLINNKWKIISGNFPQKLISTLWFQVNVPVIAKKLKFDIFWGTRHNLPIFLSKKVKTLLTIHDIVHRLFPETMYLPNLIIERLLMGPSLKKTNYIVCGSKATANDLDKYYNINKNDKTIIMPYGTPKLVEYDDKDEIIFDKLNLPKSYFLFVGSLEPRKNLRRIIDAFNMIEPSKHKVHLVLVGGKGWKNNDILKRLNEKKIKDYIQTTGYITNKELEGYYKNALCLLFPSLYEGFGFPIVEAMSLGVPVITSNISSMPEVAGDAAILVDPYNTCELANSMKRIINDKFLRNDMINKGFEQVKKISWERCAKKIYEIFDNLA